MINKSQFESLENELDVYAKKRQLNSDLAKQYIDDYFELLLLFFKQINEIESIDLNEFFRTISIYVKKKIPLYGV